MVTPEPSEFFKTLDVFASPEHLPFRWDGGQPAAVLVHGFPGTPADVRPLGHSLHAAGWTVDAPLLPGFGPQIATLPGRRYSEWVSAITRHIARLKEEKHTPVIVIGHSMGGALSLLATTSEQTDGQILLAPYWRFGHPVLHTLWPFLRLLARRWRPLKRADFQDQRVRNAVLRFLPQLDLDAPHVQEELRRFAVPVSLLDELRRVGIAAYAGARRSRVNTLVVQGLRDTLVRPPDTRLLFKRLAMPVRIELVDGTHNFVRPEDGAWDRVERTVLGFASSLLSRGPWPQVA